VVEETGGQNAVDYSLPGRGKIFGKKTDTSGRSRRIRRRDGENGERQGV